MKRQCAWCGTQLGEGADGGPGGGVTHGICPDCYADVNGRAGVPIQEFIASLDEPVFFVDEDHTVGMANAPAVELAGKAPEEIIGERHGTVLECSNAHLPGGCGHTVHCSGCAIRQAIAHTHLTGEAQERVPATLQVVRNPTLADAELTITTRQVGDKVLLKIESLRTDADDRGAEE